MASGNIFDIQHYAVHDGPGIRTLVFFKGCPLRCAWCCNPESQETGRELRHFRSRCAGCGTCATLCPSKAVESSRESPRFAREKCARCEKAACVEACVNDALQWVGKRMEVAQIVERVAADLPFYRNSGGGVTISGGEPFAQPDFLLELLSALRARGIHTAVETCGHTSHDAFAKALPLIDLILFDVKIVNSERHRTFTGASNELILENLRQAACDPQKLLLRVPVIPGCTDDLENLEAIARLAAELKLERITLQPYHALGAVKNEQLGRASPFEAEPPSPETLQRAIDLFVRHGLQCELA